MLLPTVVFNYAASTLMYALSLHDALPISKKFKIAEGQWYRYAPSYVSPAYHLLEGFPFIQEPPSGDLQERVLKLLRDRKSGSAGMPRPISYAVSGLKKKINLLALRQSYRA